MTKQVVVYQVSYKALKQQVEFSEWLEDEDFLGLLADSYKSEDLPVVLKFLKGSEIFPFAPVALSPFKRGAKMHLYNRNKTAKTEGLPDFLLPKKAGRPLTQWRHREIGAEMHLYIFGKRCRFARKEVQICTTESLEQFTKAQLSGKDETPVEPIKAKPDPCKLRLAGESQNQKKTQPPTTHPKELGERKSKTKQPKTEGESQPPTPWGQSLSMDNWWQNNKLVEERGVSL